MTYGQKFGKLNDSKFHLAFLDRFDIILRKIALKGKERSDEKKILREMKDEIHPWKKILRKKKFDKMLPYAKGQSTIAYSIPEKSNEFVKNAWKK